MARGYSGGSWGEPGGHLQGTLRTEGLPRLSCGQMGSPHHPRPGVPSPRTHINLSAVKAVLVYDPGSKRTRKWEERGRGGAGRLRSLRREGAGCQPCPRHRHFNKRLLQRPVRYNRVTPPLVSASPTHRPGPAGSPPPLGRGSGPWGTDLPGPGAEQPGQRRPQQALPATLRGQLARCQRALPPPRPHVP